MKLTRLQLLLVSVALVAGGFYGYSWWQSHSDQSIQPFLSRKPTPAPAIESLITSKPPPPIPKIAQHKKTPASATPANSSNDISYTVVKGDTLWHIAIDQSPAHQGPAWVAIYLVNKSVIKDFDHVDPGTELMIPSELKDYVMPYWKPRDLASAKAASTMSVVDLRQLPTGAESVLVDLHQLPTVAESVLVDLKQLPATMDTMLAEVPKDFRVNLNELPAAPEMALASNAPEEFTTSAFRWPVEDYIGRPQYH